MLDFVEIFLNILKIFIIIHILNSKNLNSNFNIALTKLPHITE